MGGLEQFDATVTVYSDTSARGLEYAFRLPAGSLQVGEEAHIVGAGAFDDGKGVGDLKKF